MEPVRAHRLVPVARHVHQAAGVSRRARHRIGRARVHLVMAREHDRPVVVVGLVRKEERAGEAVVLRAVMAVVLVRRDRVASEAVVRAHVHRQPVVVPEQHRLAVAHLAQLRRNRAVERPHRVPVLHRHLRMEAERQRLSLDQSRVCRARHLRVIDVVRRRARLPGLERHGRRVLREALVRPHLTWRTALNRAGAAAEQRIDLHRRRVRLGGRRRREARRIQARQHVEARHRLRVRLAAEHRARRRARRSDHGRRRARDERVQAANRREQACTREQTHLEQVASRDAAPRQFPDDLRSFASCALGVTQPGFRGVGGQIDTHRLISTIAKFH